MSGLNLFDYAPKELSNTAVWAWLLSHLQFPKNATNLEYNIALRLLNRIGVPKPEDTQRVSKEVPLQNNERIDLLCKFKSGSEMYYLIIENKIEHDPDVIQQIRTYRRNMPQSYPIYSAIFTFDISLESERNRLREDGIELFTIKDMVSFFSDENISNNTILTHYFDFLVRKSRSLINEATSIQDRDESGQPLYYKWLSVARDQGVEDLFEKVLEMMREKSANIRFHGTNSITACYKRQDGGNERPLIAFWPRKSDDYNGVRIGYSDTCSKYLSLTVNDEYLPSAFDKQYYRADQNDWYFGSIYNEDDLRRFFDCVAPNRNTP